MLWGYKPLITHDIGGNMAVSFDISSLVNLIMQLLPLIIVLSILPAILRLFSS
ncbi:hypothetical protein ATG_18750 [Desulfurococcaceae archaeon AG1]|nr:hypothetical protein ATG_18750 [Desulfurococcaceae archaeon AG1]